MMQQLVLSWLKISLGAGKTIVTKNCFKSGFGIQLVQKSNTFTVTMVSLLPMLFIQIVLININLRVFQELVIIIKIFILSMPLRQLCT